MKEIDNDDLNNDTLLPTTTDKDVIKNNECVYE